MVADAKLAELSLLEREGKSLPLESFKRLLGLVVAELRARITAFPGKYAPRIVGLKSIGQAQAILEEIANDFLATLRQAGGDVRDVATRGSERAQPRRRGRPRGPTARP
jgi:hypothetical protein